MILLASSIAFLLTRPQTSQPFLNVPDGSTILMAARVEGVVEYDSLLDPQSPTGLNWRAKGPDATLYDGAHHRIGRLTPDRSVTLDDATNITMDIRHLQSVPANNPDAESWSTWPVTVPSLLGPLAGVNLVMRIETSGGGAPHDKPTPDHKTFKSPFAATYLFLGSDAQNPNFKYRTIIDSSVGNVDWGNITVGEALNSACFFPGVPYYASPELTARINIREKNLTFGQALRLIGEQAHAEVFLRNGKVYAVPR